MNGILMWELLVARVRWNMCLSLRRAVLAIIMARRTWRGSGLAAVWRPTPLGVNEVRL